ncbi:hypothetical protein Bca52824_053302 [Brassica carinata]|uniref:peroxidase n=1 Tax=Brassica carinata TaxID=52824 RepID=A0A8X7R5M8_BRACI|nr:hypothetical protein Bca52824_053302 [Brassica carinata]
MNHNKCTGAHTFGRVQCGVITNRLHNFTGNNGQSDPSIEPKFLRTLRRKCPQGRSLTARVNLDPTSPDSFDNDYFKNLQNNRGVIESDQILFSSKGAPTVSLVNRFAKSQQSEKVLNDVVEVEMVSCSTYTRLCFAAVQHKNTGV